MRTVGPRGPGRDVQETDVEDAEPLSRPERKDPRPRLLALILAAVGLSAVIAGCSGGDSSESLDSENNTTVFEAKPAITFAVSNWTASALNAAVAEQLIERHLGYPVIAARIDDTTEIYDGLAGGDVDAVLEIWPSGMTDRDRLYFERDEVVDLGPLGPVGKIGWFVPRYVVDENPALASWEALLDANTAAVFATAETSPNGRLLGTSPDYRQFDEEIVSNLGLPLDVVFSGSEEATIAELEASHAAKEPILLYWWTPTGAVAQFDLVNVALPPPTDDCLTAAEAGGDGVDCDYAEEELFKASSPELATKAPDVDGFVRSFTLTNEDQLSMLAAVEARGLTVEAAAAEWIEANAATWEVWLAG